MNFDLTEENFMLFAAKNYTNTSCVDILEFKEDLNRIKYIKKLFKRYQSKQELKERLIINHFVVFYNVFETEAATKMILFKNQEYLSYVKTFLLYLHLWPKTISISKSLIIDCEGIPFDKYIHQKLMEL
jgi:hypothetical protein